MQDGEGPMVELGSAKVPLGAITRWEEGDLKTVRFFVLFCLLRLCARPVAAGGSHIVTAAVEAVGAG